METDGVIEDRLDSSEAMLRELYSRQGFLLRRAHQISVALFLEATEGLGVTSTQYAALFVIDNVEGLDQIGLARLMGIDRSTSALVVGKLEKANWISRRTDPQDRRRKMLVATPQGRDLLQQIIPLTADFRHRMMSPFTPEEHQTFMHLLTRFTQAFNDDIRNPILPLDR